MTFQDVRDELYTEQISKKVQDEYMFVTRKTVLGRWHQHKMDLWDQFRKTFPELVA